MPTFRIISHVLRMLMVVLISMPFVLLLVAVQTERLVSDSEPLNAADLDEIEQLLLDSAPSSTVQPSQQRLRLNTRQLDLLMRFGLQVMHLSPAWSSDATLDTGVLAARLSIAVGGSRVPLFLNIQGTLEPDNETLDLSTLRIGHLTLPESIGSLAVSRLRKNLLATDVAYQDFSELIANIEQIEISAESMTLTMLWQPELIDRIASRSRQMFVPEADRQRILAYYEEIRAIVATIPTDLGAVSLNTFLAPLFNHAHRLSLQGSDPVAENQAVLQALAIYVNNENIQRLLGPETEAVTPVKFIEVRLQRRQDLAQHLVSIAATTSSAGAGFAQLLSTTKEAYDARYNSGFSFSDLTANSSGVTLGTFATRDEESALELQLRLSSIENESDYMPIVGNNRDGISEADFAAIYRDRNSPEFQQRLEEIQSLILDRPLFQGLQ